METWVDVLIQGSCYRHTDAITNVKHGDAYVDTYRFEPMAVVLSQWEKINKDKFGKH